MLENSNRKKEKAIHIIKMFMICWGATQNLREKESKIRVELNN